MTSGFNHTALHLPSSRTIGHSFGKHASSYDRFADIQSDIILHVRSLLTATGETISHPWVDIGSGSGLVGHFLAKAGLGKAPVGFDLSRECLHYAISHHHYRNGCQGDCDALPFQSDSLSAISVTSVLQWTQNLGRIFEDFCRVLSPGGTLVLAAFVTGSYQELSEVRTALGVPDPIHVLPEHQLLALVERSGFTITKSSLFQRTYHYASPLKLLRHLVGTGSTAHQDSPPASVFAFSREYRRRFERNGSVPLSCRALALIARKK